MSKFKIVEGSACDASVIKQVRALDCLVYPPHYVGKEENLTRRFLRLPDSLLLLYAGETIAGYVNFFPMAQTMYRQMTSPAYVQMRDDDILPAEMADYQKGGRNDIFILSVAVAPDFRGKEAAVTLSSGLYDFLRAKNDAGNTITSFGGCVVSAGGSRFLERFGAEKRKQLTHGAVYYYADEKAVQQVMQHGLKVGKKGEKHG